MEHPSDPKEKKIKTKNRREKSHLFQRSTQSVIARHDALSFALFNLMQSLGAHARHNAHGQSDIGRISNLKE